MGGVGSCGGNEALAMEADEFRGKALGDRLTFVLS